MADELERFEAVMGAVAKITSGDTSSDMLDARCPKCQASSFAQISDLFVDAVGRVEEQPDQADVVREGGMTNAQMIAKFKPPTRRSPTLRVLGAAIPLGAVAFYVYRRFGETPGQFAFIGAAIVTIVVLLTTLRRTSDEYYAARRRWRSLYMCRKCGQLVSS